jgi:tetratricopeptide (TPR) repeat protein
MKASPKLWSVILVLMAIRVAVGSEGTESPFGFGAGARELALGGAAAANSADATAVFWNPSQLTLAQKISVTGMHSELLIDGAVYQYLGVAVPTLDLGGFGLGLFRQSIQDIDKRDDNNMSLGEFDDSQLRLYLGYGRRLGRFEIGTSLSVDHQSIDIYRATSSPGLTLSASSCRDPKPTWLTDLRMSAVVRNVIRPGIRLAEETYRYPTALEVSGSIRIVQSHGTDHALEPSVTFRKTGSVPVQIYAGIEYSYKQLLQLRMGIRQRHFSFGAGINLGVISFDYALVDRDLDFVHLFALTGTFGTPVNDRKKSRSEKQEADFRQAMNLQIKERNFALLEELLAAGHNQLTAGQYDEAAGSFDRLVFLARSAGLDEAEYEKLLDSAIGLRSVAEMTSLLEAAVDSATLSLASGDYLTARHHALRALEADSGCPMARQLFEKADRALRLETERTEFLSEQLIRADSLIDLQQFDKADLIVRSLTEMAPEDDAVMRRINRLELERLRRKIADLESHRLDSMHTMAQFPAPAGDTGLAGSDSTLARIQTEPLSEEQHAELRQLYQEAKGLFNEGDIRAAVKRWETVAARAPDFQSVREFLIKAYKFLGLELYGQKQRSEAIAVWRKALSLDPDNVDIVEYIKRAETQMKRLDELAHEQSG